MLVKCSTGAVTPMGSSMSGRRGSGLVPKSVGGARLLAHVQADGLRATGRALGIDPSRLARIIGGKGSASRGERVAMLKRFRIALGSWDESAE